MSRSLDLEFPPPVVEFVEASSGWQIKGIERTSSNGQFIVTRPPLPKSMLDTLKRGFWDDSDDDDSTSNNNNLTSAPAPIADVEEASGGGFSRRGEAMSIAASSGAASSVQSAGGTILHRGWDKAKRPRNQLREPSDVVDRVKRVQHAEDLSSAVAEVKKNMSLRQVFVLFFMLILILQLNQRFILLLLKKKKNKPK